MKLLFRFLFILGAIVPHTARAQATANAGAAAGPAASGTKSAAVSSGRYEFFMNSGFIGISSGASQYDLGPGFQFIPFSRFSWLQTGGELTYQKISYKGGSTGSTLILLGLTVNLGGNTINECFFANVGFGLKSGSTTVEDPLADDPGGSGFFFVVGKRIPLGGAFSFRPSFGMVSAGKSEILVRPIGLSILF